mmetsp:Transcript_55695/g.180803  ORF Transcript_55695/g.180803 Transcript_55695/m.180803 type:complete len:208 (-) Transcript_55695:466-1089(-)
MCAGALPVARVAWRLCFRLSCTAPSKQRWQCWQFFAFWQPDGLQNHMHGLHSPVACKDAPPDHCGCRDSRGRIAHWKSCSASCTRVDWGGKGSGNAWVDVGGAGGGAGTVSPSAASILKGSARSRASEMEAKPERLPLPERRALTGQLFTDRPGVPSSEASSAKSSMKVFLTLKDEDELVAARGKLSEVEAKLAMDGLDWLAIEELE